MELCRRGRRVEGSENGVSEIAANPKFRGVIHSEGSGGIEAMSSQKWAAERIMRKKPSRSAALLR